MVSSVYIRWPLTVHFYLSALFRGSGQARKGKITHVDLLRDRQSKLAVGGVLRVGQASGPLHGKILKAVEHDHRELHGPFIWDRGRVQPGASAKPYSGRMGGTPVLHNDAVKPPLFSRARSSSSTSSGFSRAISCNCSAFEK